MLAKVIGLKKKGPYAVDQLVDYVAEDRAQEDAPELYSSDPTAVAEYLGREGVCEGGSFNLEGLNPADPADRALIAAQMNHVARAGQARTGFKSNPFYHFILSWREGEHPTIEQAEAAAMHALKALGMSRCQAMFAVHRDKAHHHHVHVVVNRVAPDTLTLAGPPRYDYFVLDRACREIELAQGWQHDVGPYVVIDGQPRRMGKAEREETGLGRGKATPESAMAESKSGLPSLATWAKAYVTHELLDCQTWEDIHEVLARRGMRLEKLRSGLQIVAHDLDGREHRTKASALDYRLSLGRLQERMGKYRDFAPSVQVIPALTYAKHLKNVMRGVEPAAGEIPGVTGQGRKREIARRARAEAREALYERYQYERRRAASDGRRRELAQRHKEERKALRRQLSALKPKRVSELAREYGPKIALALWAAERAQALAELQAKQQIEKKALKTATNISWRAWLERESASGDRAAQAALRGIRYREQRNKKAIPGFEGEDLEESLENAPAARRGGEQREVTGIAGEVKSFDLSRFEIDHLRQMVRYLDARGDVALEDKGQRIECLKHDDDAVVRAGLLLAAQKYGGEVFITGNEAFRARAAAMAREMGIRVANPEMGGGFERSAGRQMER